MRPDQIQAGKIAKYTRHSKAAPAPAGYLNTDDAAKLLGVTSETLAKWRFKKLVAVPYFKIGKIVFYSAADIDAFIQSQKINEVK